MLPDFKSLLPLPTSWMHSPRADRTLADRRRLLRATINCLQKHAHRQRKTDLLSKVFEILAEARNEVIDNSRDRVMVRDSPQRQNSKQSKEDRGRRQAILDELSRYEYHLTVPSIESDEPEHGLLPLVRELRSRIEKLPSPPLISLPEGRANLSPITGKARRRLLEAGVPQGLSGFAKMKVAAKCQANARNLQESLLMAVGLIPYRRK